MKNLLLPVILFALVLWSACGEDPHNGFIINGRFENPQGHKVYLNKVLGNSLIAVDSTSLKGEGSFSFKGTHNSTRFYIVSVVSKDRKVTNNLQLLVGAKERIMLAGNLNNDLKASYTVDGSKDSKLIKTLNDRLRQTTKTLDSIANAYRAAMEKNTLDSALKAKLDVLNKNTYTVHRKFSEDIILNQDSSLVGIMALFQHMNRHETVFNIQNDFELYNKALSNLSPVYPESELVKSLRMMVTAQQRKHSQAKTNRLAIEVGTMAPEIMLPDPKGNEIALSSLKGRYVLLDFWAAWCRPCRKENPNLVKNYKKYKKKGFRIYQVSLDKTKEDWVKAIKEDRLTWYHVSDLKFWKSEAAKLYNVRTIPSSFLIDPEGKVVAIDLRGDGLGEKLKEIYLF